MPADPTPPPIPSPRTDAAARILDANLNRAREALRVIEDAARFALDDRGLVERAKTVRHSLTEAVASLPPVMSEAARLASRDTPGDVGTTVSTDAERTRRGLGDVVAAAGSRLSEALRAIEEVVKLADPEAAARVESARYAGYDLAARVRTRLGAASRRQWRLCVLVTADRCALPWETTVERAIAGGADAIQLREKGLTDRELLARARRLVEICRADPDRSAAVVVNDRPDIAVLAGADGVHVGQDDLSVADVRRIVGFGILVGVSTSDLGTARAAVEAGADVCGLGPMYPSTTKAKPVLAGPAYARAYLADPALARVPHLTIGGIDAENVGELAAAGVVGVAVSAAVCGSPDPESAARAIRDALEQNTPAASRVDAPAAR